ncbi:CPBP family intramembrane glutamic endopeptidase [Amycolatopsis pithecellobii]|uniref:CPBP family intramembrane metalloprotease n=1 Tax=Amycolatopsis pithecellobii TaxID=664692 RepID=A0A6N7ZA58_9PSEU|nr:CPBP family intramembrane glutamic endopeptidase [Amycolatopsis pithecellobii]MTD58625.1 CPBP family intramembrane metalloprotease [Amycolatopsis pithecellobii]
MNNGRGLVGRYPLTSFFVLAFGLSWLAWTPYVLSENGLGLVPLHFPVIAGSTQLLGVLPGAYLGPILSAFLVTALAYGRPGLRQWLGRFLKWRVSWRWYLSVLLGVPIALALTSIPFSAERHLPTASLLGAYAVGLVFQMITTGLAEEPGWRDFALPHLQPRFGALRGTILLGVLWGCWHLPLFLTEWGGWPEVRPLKVVEFLVSCAAISIVMTWVFNRTKESLPIAMILHTSVNNFMSVAWLAMFPAVRADDSMLILLIAFSAAAIILLVTTRGRLGYRAPATREHELAAV